MSREHQKQETWRISDLAAQLPEALVQEVEPAREDDLSISAERIAQLAQAKRIEHLTKEAPPVKKASIRVLLIAALICLISISGFAAVGGLDYIRDIFGDSADTIEKEIETPLLSATAEDRTLSLEALVTDGFVTNMVLSLTGPKPADDIEPFTFAGDLQLRASDRHVLDTFSNADVTFYAVELVNETRFETADITLALNESIAPISLDFQIENHLGNAVVAFPEGAMSGETKLVELQVSPMGFLLIGHEENAQGGLPPTNVKLVFAEGTTEDMSVQFAPSDETMNMGGGAVIDGRSSSAPLVVSFYGNRNPDGELVISGQFSRIIDPAQIEKVVVDGMAYPLSEQ